VKPDEVLHQAVEERERLLLAEVGMLSGCQTLLLCTIERVEVLEVRLARRLHPSLVELGE
jgi:hypothetical protein